MTPFGKAIRHLRIEYTMMLGDMAEALGLSASYLSQIETGKKAIPPGLPDRIGSLFNLDVSAAAALREAAAISMSEFKISLDEAAPSKDRVLANELALEFARLTPEAKEKIQQIVRGQNS